MCVYISRYKYETKKHRFNLYFSWSQINKLLYRFDEYIQTKHLKTEKCIKGLMKYKRQTFIL